MRRSFDSCVVAGIVKGVRRNVEILKFSQESITVLRTNLTTVILASPSSIAYFSKVCGIDVFIDSAKSYWINISLVLHKSTTNT